jgi:hypothetical protein
MDEHNRVNIKLRPNCTSGLATSADISQTSASLVNILTISRIVVWDTGTSHVITLKSPSQRTKETVSFPKMSSKSKDREKHNWKRH